MPKHAIIFVNNCNATMEGTHPQPRTKKMEYWMVSYYTENRGMLLGYQYFFTMLTPLALDIL
jgi:hypothetical protein